MPCWQAFSPASVSDTNEIVGPYPEIGAKDLPKVRDLLLNIPDLETNKYLSQRLKSVCYIAGEKSWRVGTVLKSQILAKLKPRCVSKHAV